MRGKRTQRRERKSYGVDPRLKLKLRRLAKATCKAGRFQRFLSPFSDHLPLFEHYSRRSEYPSVLRIKKKNLGRTIIRMLSCQMTMRKGRLRGRRLIMAR